MDFIVQGKVVSLDDEDFYISNIDTWWLTSDKNHVYTTVNRQTVLLHRVVMNVNDPTIHVHHRDENGLNNRKINLQIMTKKEHDALLSSKAQSNSKSGIVGVYFDNGRGLWRAQIGRKVLGRFSTKEAAIKAREGAIR